LKSKLTIIICSIVGVLAIVGVVLFLVLGNNKVTISFDSDGGSKVESIQVKKGETAKLPIPTKENSQFDGWYYNDLKAGEDSHFTENITLKAHWIEAETIKITFETNGGSKIESINIVKGEEFKEPEKPTKEGFNFIGWYDKNETPISEGALLSEDTTLYAKWEEIKETVATKKYTVTFDSDGGSKVNSITIDEGSELTLPKNPTKSDYTFTGWFTKNGTQVKNGYVVKENITLYAHWEKVKTYTCPTGYTLSGTKCTIEGTVKTKCDENKFDYNEKCITISGAVSQNPERKCGKTTVHTGGGHTEEMQGELFQIGTYFCFYGVVTDSYEQNSSNCTSRGHKWNSQNNKCYYTRGDANENIIYTCSAGYEYIGNPNTYQGVNGLNGGCFPISEKTKYCDDGYTLTNNKCIKTIDATLK